MGAFYVLVGLNIHLEVQTMRAKPVRGYVAQRVPTLHFSISLKIGLCG